MKYLVIDTDGQLYQRTAPRYDVALRDVGPEGWARVRVDRTPPVLGPLGAFVNDCGLIMPERYERNVVGACLLVAFGAGQQPYAGPIVITGWQEDPYELSDEPEVRGLNSTQVDILRQVHGDVRKAVGLDQGELAAPQADGWREAIVELAEMVRTGPVPAVRILTEPAEVEAWLRRRP